MLNIFLIGVGGFFGAVSRYLLTGVVQGWSRVVTLPNGAELTFPLGTLAVNMIGCFVIGMLTHLVEARNLFDPQTRMMVFFGFLGAFTTYSTFSNETVNLIRDGAGVMSLVNIGVHLVLGLGMVGIGRWIGSFITG